MPMGPQPSKTTASAKKERREHGGSEIQFDATAQSLGESGHITGVPPCSCLWNGSFTGRTGRPIQ